MVDMSWVNDHIIPNPELFNHFFWGIPNRSRWVLLAQAFLVNVPHNQPGGYPPWNQHFRTWNTGNWVRRWASFQGPRPPAPWKMYFLLNMGIFQPSLCSFTGVVRSPKTAGSPENDGNSRSRNLLDSTSRGVTFRWTMWAMKKRPPGWLGYIWDYTTQLYRDYNKPL